MKYLLCGFLYVFSCSSLASNCIKMDNIEWLDKSFDFSFTGRIERKERDFSLTTEKYLVAVMESNHGDIPDNLVVWTPNPSNCGAMFEVGKEYVIFAKMYKGKIMTYYDSSWIVSEKTEAITREYLEFYRANRLNP